MLAVLVFAAAPASAGTADGTIAEPEGRPPWLWPASRTLPEAPARPARGRLVLERLLETEAFLSKRGRGLPYSPDPRPLTPTCEAIRLLVDAQALGYLNLHVLTGGRRFLAEARTRLDYIIATGDDGLRGAALDGQIGWSFLYAYEVTRDPRYLHYGLGIADRCLTYGERIPNWAYAAALNLGKAHAITARQEYLQAARLETRRTASLQFPDGAFPHREGREFGENSQYTSWLLFEMICHRRDDPEDPDMDPAILKAAAFLARRVNPDGSLNYEDEAGSYWSNPFDADTRGWISEIPTVAFVMEATGRHELAQRLVGFLCANALAGPDRGGYPDKWAFHEPANPWATGHPSVVRTSMVFWMLSAYLLECRVEQNGLSRPCRITADDCNASFRDLNQCFGGLPGHDVCIDGRFTGCLDENLVRYSYRDTCDLGMTCEHHPTQDAYLITICPTLGDRKCVAGACADTCFNQMGTSCSTSWSPQDLCLGPHPRDSGAPGPDEQLPSLLGGGSAGAGGIVVSFVLEQSAAVRLEVFDVAGRRVLTQPLGVFAAGRHVASTGGNPALPAGIYLVRVTLGSKVATAKIVVQP